jgi:hypothetical protein
LTIINSYKRGIDGFVLFWAGGWGRFVLDGKVVVAQGARRIHGLREVFSGRSGEAEHLRNRCTLYGVGRSLMKVNKAVDSLPPFGRF